MKKGRHRCGTPSDQSAYLDAFGTRRGLPLQDDLEDSPFLPRRNKDLASSPARPEMKAHGSTYKGLLHNLHHYLPVLTVAHHVPTSALAPISFHHSSPVTSSSTSTLGVSSPSRSLRRPVSDTPSLSDACGPYFDTCHHTIWSAPLRVPLVYHERHYPRHHIVKHRHIRLLVRCPFRSSRYRLLAAD